MTTIDWLTYDALYSVIRAHGFAETLLQKRGVLFRHPDGAELVFPSKSPDEAVISLHYGATQTVMMTYGIMTRDAFDLALLQAAHRLPTSA